MVTIKHNFIPFTDQKYLNKVIKKLRKRGKKSVIVAIPGNIPSGLDAEDATRIRLENGAIHCLDLKENRDCVEIAVGKKRRRESGFDKDMEDMVRIVFI